MFEKYTLCINFGIGIILMQKNKNIIDKRLDLQAELLKKSDL